MNPRAKGSIVINETILPITDIYLRHGKIVFVGTVIGPVPATTATSCTIHDAEGHVVTRGVDLKPIRWHDVAAGESLTVHMPVLLNGESGPISVKPDHPYHRMKRREVETFGAPFKPTS